ncbi:MAG: glycosyltransferase [Pseudomonadota bacterium]
MKADETRTRRPGAAPLRVAFVACNRNRRRYQEDPSFLYRCRNLAAALACGGHQTRTVHLHRLNPWAPLDAVVFHRPRYTPRFRAVLTILRRRGVRVLADVDDLIFDEALAGFSPGVMNGQVEEGETRAVFAAHRRALAEMATITVSTAPLADEARRCFPGAEIAQLPNAVHADWRALSPGGAPPSDRPAITYFPGTRSHDRDFALVAPVLEALLARHPELEVHITGPLEFHLRARPGQVRHHPKVAFEALHPRVRAARVNIAPLERTPFTRCKSALKVMEAGYWGVPTVTSPLPDAERFAGDGVAFADAEAHWHDALERLLDPEHHAAQTAGLRERVLARADVHRVAESFARVIRCGAGRS